MKGCNNTIVVSILCLYWIKYIIHALEIHVGVRDGWVPDWGATAASSGVIFLGFYGNQGEGCYPVSHIKKFHMRSVKIFKKSKKYLKCLSDNSMDLGFKMNWSIVWVIMGQQGYPQNAGVLVVLVRTALISCCIRNICSFRWVNARKTSFLHLPIDMWFTVILYFCQSFMKTKVLKQNKLLPPYWFVATKEVACYCWSCITKSCVRQWDVICLGWCGPWVLSCTWLMDNGTSQQWVVRDGKNRL